MTGRQLASIAIAVCCIVTIGFQARAVRASVPAEVAANQPETADALARQVYDLFTQQCIKCHGPAKAGGLDLRTEEGLRKGGSSGPVVIAHRPDESDLFRHVSHREAPFMPAGAAKLPDESLDVIRRWNRIGRVDRQRARGVARCGRRGGGVGQARGAADHGRRARLLGVRQTGAAGASGRHRPRLEPQCPRRLSVLGDEDARPVAGASGRQAHARAPRVSRRARIAADARRDRRVRRTIRRPTPGRGWSIGCWRRPTTANAGRGTGWIWSATPTPAASSSTSTGRRCTAIATT